MRHVGMRNVVRADAELARREEGCRHDRIGQRHRRRYTESAADAADGRPAFAMTIRAPRESTLAISEARPMPLCTIP